jgi:hypothetical protein
MIHFAKVAAPELVPCRIRQHVGLPGWPCARRDISHLLMLRGSPTGQSAGWGRVEGPPATPRRSSSSTAHRARAERWVGGRATGSAANGWLSVGAGRRREGLRSPGQPGPLTQSCSKLVATSDVLDKTFERARGAGRHLGGPMTGYLRPAKERPRRRASGGLLAPHCFGVA